MRVAAAIAAVVTAAAAASVTGHAFGEDGSALAPYTVVGDAIPDPLAGKTGDAARGRRIVVDREMGNCLACHRIAETGAPFQGDLGPDLSAVGSRLTAGQIRLRLVDQSRLNPATLMPPYYRVAGLTRVAAQYAGRPVLTAQEIEDVVAYLTTLANRK